MFDLVGLFDSVYIYHCSIESRSDDDANLDIQQALLEQNTRKERKPDR